MYVWRDLLEIVYNLVLQKCNVLNFFFGVFRTKDMVSALNSVTSEFTTT